MFLLHTKAMTFRILRAPFFHINGFAEHCDEEKCVAMVAARLGKDQHGCKFAHKTASGLWIGIHPVNSTKPSQVYENGKKCPYNHTPKPEPKPEPTRKADIPCHWGDKCFGGKNGANCPYKHKPKPEPTRKPKPEPTRKADIPCRWDSECRGGKNGDTCPYKHIPKPEPTRKPTRKPTHKSEIPCLWGGKCHGGKNGDACPYYHKTTTCSGGVICEGDGCPLYHC